MNPRAARHSQAAQRYARRVHQHKQAEETARQERMQQAEQEFQSQLATTRLRIMMAEDGEDATTLLAALAVVIGTPCEAMSRVHGRTQEVRIMHGALRTVVDLCVSNHYRWRSEFAQALDTATELAARQKDGLPDATFTAAWIEANGLATSILAHAVTRDQIA